MPLCPALPTEEYYKCLLRTSELPNVTICQTIEVLSSVCSRSFTKLRTHGILWWPRSKLEDHRPAFATGIGAAATSPQSGRLSDKILVSVGFFKPSVQTRFSASELHCTLRLSLRQSTRCHGIQILAYVPKSQGLPLGHSVPSNCPRILHAEVS